MESDGQISRFYFKYLTFFLYSCYTSIASCEISLKNRIFLLALLHSLDLYI